MLCVGEHQQDTCPFSLPRAPLTWLALTFLALTVSRQRSLLGRVVLAPGDLCRFLVSRSFICSPTVPPRPRDTRIDFNRRHWTPPPQWEEWHLRLTSASNFQYGGAIYKAPPDADAWLSFLWWKGGLLRATNSPPRTMYLPSIGPTNGVTNINAFIGRLACLTLSTTTTSINSRTKCRAAAPPPLLETTAEDRWPSTDPRCNPDPPQFGCLP